MKKKEIFQGQIWYHIKIDKCILAIVGPSGSGKTTMANVMAENGIPTIVSYTTRPKRDGETDGKEHWFVKPEDKPNESEILAYTVFGGYEYWVTKHQVRELCTYIIDEDGLDYLMKKIDKNTLVFTIYLYRDEEKIKASGVDQERIDRDKERPQLSEEKYNLIIQNDMSLDEFKSRVKEATLELLK